MSVRVMGRTAHISELERELVDAYPALRRFAAVVADGDMDPDDVVQEAVTRVLASGRRQLNAIDDVAAYARRSIVSVCSNVRRGFARRAVAMARLGPRGETEQPTYPSEVDVLDGLEPRERAVLYLQHVEGRTSAEIGAVLDLSDTAVRAIASRARRRLQFDSSSVADPTPAREV